MAGGRNRLSIAAIRAVKTRARIADGAGLWLNVTSSGSKSWVYRWTPRGGKVRELGVGAYPTVSLARAREIADQYRKWVSEGIDPKTERDREVGKTFGQVADQYFEEMKSRWSNEKTRWQWENTLTNSAKPIRAQQVAAVKTADILRILKPIWMKTPETAARTRMRLEAVLDYAKARNWRDGENPARWKGHLEHLLAKRDKRLIKHHPAMPFSELPNFMPELRNQEGLSARALELTILAATRTSETLKSTWQEFDFENRLWTISAERMKAKSEHRIPLSEPAFKLVAALYQNRTSDWVFPGQAVGKPLSAMSMEMLLRRMRVDRYTVHGFRSTFRDWCGDETSFPREVAEAALAHKVGSEVEQSYRRSDALEKRRRLMESWANFCLNLNSPIVVPIQKAVK